MSCFPELMSQLTSFYTKMYIIAIKARVHVSHWCKLRLLHKAIMNGNVKARNYGSNIPVSLLDCTTISLVLEYSVIVSSPRALENIQFIFCSYSQITVIQFVVLHQVPITVGHPELSGCITTLWGCKLLYNNGHVHLARSRCCWVDRSALNEKFALQFYTGPAVGIKSQTYWSWVQCFIFFVQIIQMCSEITSGKVFNGELYAQRFQKLIYLHLFTDCFMEISHQPSEQIHFWTELYLFRRLRRYFFMKQSVNKCR